MRNQFTKVLTVFPTFSTGEKAQELTQNEISRVARLLGIDESRIILEDKTAKDFFLSKSNLSYFEDKSEKIDDSPF